MSNWKMIGLVWLLIGGLSACDGSPSPEMPDASAGANRTEAPESSPEGTVAVPTPHTILVTGATGTQGGAVARELIRRGYVVRALTRDPDSPRAAALAELGANPVRGDFDDAASLAAALDGVHGVFAVTLFWSAGFEGEIEQGRRLIDEAEKAGVEHFVLTSVAGADQSTGIPHFDSKWAVEQYLHDSDLTWTIVRPVEFMDNWEYSVAEFRDGRLTDPRPADSRHQWIAASDIGFFVGEAFDNPEAWAGVTKEIAGDELTVGELASVLSDVFGREVVHVPVSWAAFESEAGEEMARMYRWFHEDGYDVDIDSLRERYPGRVTAREFLRDLAARSDEAGAAE